MIAYIIKSSLILLLLFGLYQALLRKTKMLVFNRYFLILSVVFSLVMPFVSLPIHIKTTRSLEQIGAAFNNFMPEITPVGNQVKPDLNLSEHETASPILSLPIILLVIYSLGLVLFLSRFLRNVITIFHQSRYAEKTYYANHKLALIDYPINPYSFFNTIFVSKQDYLDKTVNDDLLDHEAAHLRQSHSIDIILIELIQIFYWFNPILILYKKAIRINHEFLADDSVVKKTENIKDYSEKLLNFIDNKSKITLTSGFLHSLTKKRLVMMTQKKSGRLSNGLRITTISGLVAALFICVSWKPSDIILLNLSGNAVRNWNQSENPEFLYLNPIQLKSLGIDLNSHGVFYKNFNPDWKHDSTRYSGIGFICNNSNYVTTIHFNETDDINGGNRFFRRKDLTKNDFYPLLIGNTKGKMSMENKTLPEDIKLLPVAICMADTKLYGRQDTIVVWFKPTEALEKVLPQNIRLGDYLRVRPSENK